MAFWRAAGLCSGIIIPGLLVFAPDETEGNQQVPNLVCKNSVCLWYTASPSLFQIVNAILLDGNKSC